MRCATASSTSRGAGRRCPGCRSAGMRLIEKGLLVGTVTRPMIRKRLRAWRRRAEAATVRAMRRVVLRHAEPPAALGLEKIGSGYGGWIVPTAAIRPELDLLRRRRRRGHHVRPRAHRARRLRRVRLRPDASRGRPRGGRTPRDEPRFRFMPVGLWSEDTTLRFFAPRNPKHVSHSVVNLQRTKDVLRGAVPEPAERHARAGPRPRSTSSSSTSRAPSTTVVQSMLEAGIRPDRRVPGDRPARQAAGVLADRPPHPRRRATSSSPWTAGT